VPLDKQGILILFTTFHNCLKQLYCILSAFCYCVFTSSEDRVCWEATRAPKLV